MAIARSSGMVLRAIAAHDVAGERIATRRLAAGRVRQTVARIVKKNALCAIATVSPDGRAHINTAYFAYSSTTLEVYFLSHPDARHCQNLRRRPETAIAVFDSAQRWGRLDRGLQLFGTCREARGAQARKAAREYGRRFRPYVQWKAGLDENDLASEYRLYRFVTKRLKVFDEREFGGAVFVSASVGRARR